MNYAKIDLMQIERNDIPTLKHALNRQPGAKFNTETLNREYTDRLGRHNDYGFALRALKEGGFGLILIGFCFVEDIDWISRHGMLKLIKVGHVPPDLDTVIMRKAADFCFDEINLNKIYCETSNAGHLSSALTELGFVAEGSRREASFYKGKFYDVTVYGLLAQEYRAAK